MAVAGAERVCRDEPPGFRMLAVIGALLYAMKAVVGVEAREDDGTRLSLPQWLAFAVMWSGMRPSLFRKLGQAPLSGWERLALSGALRLAAGAALVGLARLAWATAAPPLGPSGARLLATALLLPGLSLMLHFGIFTLATAFWRRAGVDCRPLFREPLRSRSLGEFWGRRWNLAFTEMTAIGIYRPLEGRLGRTAATMTGFCLSGLFHELAISVPVKAGFGLPLLYFLLHGALVLLERAMERRGRPIGRYGWAARAWTLAWLALPLPLLFHPAFIQGVVWPLLRP
jgi:alginate O-acetyltransferase complex protein AlgI